MKIFQWTATTRFFVFSVLFLALFSYAFGTFAEELLEKELHHFDSILIQWVESLVDPDLTGIMKFFTFMGSAKAIIIGLIVSALLMIWQHKKWQAAFLIFAVLGEALFNIMLKWIFQRQRPEIHRLIEVTGYSFPSGHSMGSFVFYGMLGYFFILFLRSESLKVVSTLLMAGLIFMIGFSRVYLGVHYPSDVLAGFAAGGAWLIICMIGLKVVVIRLEKRS